VRVHDVDGQEDGAAGRRHLGEIEHASPLESEVSGHEVVVHPAILRHGVRTACRRDSERVAAPVALVQQDPDEQVSGGLVKDGLVAAETQADRRKEREGIEEVKGRTGVTRYRRKPVADDHRGATVPCNARLGGRGRVERREGGTGHRRAQHRESRRLEGLSAGNGGAASRDHQNDDRGDGAALTDQNEYSTPPAEMTSACSPCLVRGTSALTYPRALPQMANFRPTATLN